MGIIPPNKDKEELFNHSIEQSCMPDIAIHPFLLGN
jgi:hypothetical protein